MNQEVNTDVKGIHKNRKLLWIFFAVVLAIILVAGLQPYANYENDWIDFAAEAEETTFGHYGLVVGSLPPFVEPAAQRNELHISATLTIIEPEDSSFHVFAQIDTQGSDVPLIIGQWKTSLIAINGHDRRQELKLPRASARTAGRRW